MSPPLPPEVVAAAAAEAAWDLFRCRADHECDEVRATAELRERAWLERRARAQGARS